MHFLPSSIEKPLHGLPASNFTRNSWIPTFYDFLKISSFATSKRGSGSYYDSNDLYILETEIIPVCLAPECMPR